MMPQNRDLERLPSLFPGLTYDSQAGEVRGELDFCADYNRGSGQLRIGTDAYVSASDTFLCDGFSVRIDLDRLDANGWPAVYEVGGRAAMIAERESIEMIDLHFFPDGRCCLGINYASKSNLNIEKFMHELVIPFLYRLSYIDKYGIDTARKDLSLWGEYSHGDEGYREYAEEIRKFAAAKPGRNAPCPCGNGKKYKRCHLDEVEALMRANGQYIQMT